MPGTTERQSLKAFAKERVSHHGDRAFMTTLPQELLEECIDGYRSGLGPKVITDYIQAMGYPEATKPAVGQWLASHAPRDVA